MPRLDSMIPVGTVSDALEFRLMPHHHPHRTEGKGL